jgi:hypothetical protein
MQGARDGLLVLNVWCPCWARFGLLWMLGQVPNLVRLSVAHRETKKETSEWNKIDFMGKKRSTKNGLSALKYVE